MRILVKLHRCISSSVCAAKRTPRLRRIGQTLALLLLLFLAFTVIRYYTTHWRIVYFGTDQHPSVLGITGSKMKILLADYDSREVRSSNADVATVKIGVSIVLNRTEACESISEYEMSDNNLYLIECKKEFLYYVYLLSNDFGWSRRCADFWTERLSKELRRCRQTSLHASAWIVTVETDVNIVKTLNSVMTELYIDDVTWFDVVMVTNLKKSADVWNKVRSRFTVDASSGVAPVPSGVTLVSSVASYEADEGYANSRLLLSKLHYEIIGVFFPRLLSTMADATRYIGGAVADCGNGARTGEFSMTQNTNSVTVGHNVTELVQQTCALTVRYRNSVLNRTSDSAPNKRTIAMSLYGSTPRYTMGAVRNAQLAPVLFPGWRLRFYCAPRHSRLSVPDHVLSKLRALGAEVVHVDDRVAATLAPMIWRFMVADDDTSEVFMIRDVDSRFSQREAEAVHAWLSLTPPSTFHCMRDHPWHNFSIMGGMWGARTRELRALLGGRSLVEEASAYTGEYLQDMKFIEDKLWVPYSGSHFYCHDSVYCDVWPRSHPFPSSRVVFEHVGQVFNEFSQPNNLHLEPFKHVAVKASCS